MFGVLDKLVASKTLANGLAIIIANENSCRHEHEPLSGTIKDLYATKDAFEALKFATLPIRNASKQQIIDIVQAASCYKYPKCYKRLAFVFSGHGDSGCIYAHDSEVHLQSYIFDPWMPKQAKHLADIPKLFFFDACRGDAVDHGVSMALCSSVPVAKGGRTPSVGNYLLAYSTMPTMKSFEQPKTGGYWMQHLAKELQYDSNFDCSLIEILQKVNRNVLSEMERDQCENIQQPVLESTLSQSIYLLKEAKRAGLEVNLNFPPHTPPQDVILGEGSEQSFSYIDPLCTIAYSESNQPPQTGHSIVAHENTDLPLTIDQSSMDVENRRGYYRGVLNHLSQTKKINIVDYFDEPPRHDGTRMLYKCHVSVELFCTGKIVTGSSNCVESKNKAQEQAAEDACNQIQSLDHGMAKRHLIKSVQEGRGWLSIHNYVKSHSYKHCLELFGMVQLAGSSLLSTTSLTSMSTSKVWKSKLKEYFDKKYKDVKMVIKYITKECPRGGFTSTVYCPDIGYAEGEGPNKQAAEHSAACNALKKLES